MSKATSRTNAIEAEKETENGITTRVWTDAEGKEHLRYDARVYLGRDPETRRAMIRSKTFKRKGDAERWRRELQVKHDRGEVPAMTKITLKKWLEVWLDTHSTQVRDSTISTYRAKVKRWIFDPPEGTPLLAHVQLQRLTVTSFDQLYRHMSEQGLTPRAVLALHEVLRPALKAAIKKGYLTQSPVELATRPKPNAKGRPVEEVEAGKVRALTKEEAARFLEAAREERTSALWHVLLTGGLRPGEALALRWRDIDFEAGEVHVRRSLSRSGVDKEEHGKGWQITAPKTDKSVRTVPLPPPTMEELTRWRKRQARERLRLGPEWQDHGLAFTSEIGTPLGLSNLRRGAFNRICARAGLGEWGPEPRKPRSGPTRQRPFRPSYRVYDLRHTFASHLLASGVPVLTVSRLLGHATINLTLNTYAHFMPEQHREYAQASTRIWALG
jgi:integrase